jgi:hypothetical protein
MTGSSTPRTTTRASPKVRGATFVQQAKATGEDMLAPGDRVLTRQALLDGAKAPLGTLTTDCVNVGARTAPFFSATLQCTSTYGLKDGQLVAAGTVRLDKPRTVRFPIVGGSGAYRSARGEVTPGKASTPDDSIDVLHVEG